VVEHDDRAVLQAQALERPLELLAEGDVGEGIPCSGQGVGEVDDGDAHAPVAPGLGTAGTHDDAVRPRLEPIRVAQRAQIPPDRDQRLLDSIFGGIGVAEDPAGDEEEAARNVASELLVRVAVAPLRSLDQRPAHRSRPSSLFRRRP
jgi:hypothetical protein